MSSQDVTKELQNLGEKLLVKLQQIPQADTVEIVSFSIILVFIGVVLLMVILGCSFCCCGNNKRNTVKVQPIPEV
ncbi:small integral membrane protein 5 isoform X2 [Dendropsophus ebraccatus]